MKDSFIIFNNENFQGTNVSAIVDCTITPTNAPSGSFSSKMSFYSGKYKRYCIIIEVVVNSVTGTACFVSEGEPGASHDMRLLKKTSDDINSMLNGTKLIGDKGFKGIQSLIPNGFVPTESPLLENRCLVDPYFGRLKTVYAFAREKYNKDTVIYDDLITLCCCFCNVDIGINPLINVDQTNYKNI
ncbi:hypothetical protein EIN_506730 [Entamoeba invadens IP1]|uniref:DDE Tnp4 domain-containing protein n=1 Tax=Entamoeba invadens IP1 TaxID=370355 RepID=A0A0A1UC65_ENTIV|nr:hypothetical protein EIN_506730 [Entamoeba invadens IP1]ELP92832.1 hypothetical protein EIN_506730 [Entamoeba invadens IP1]|eukprot:XP_004259603.1 hypothetical protein EIN_506730 [Entamoeba invadens IP1]